jgi:hypothetical protein
MRQFDDNMEEDPRYICCSVEHINYTPIHFDEVMAEIAKRDI